MGSVSWGQTSLWEEEKFWWLDSNVNQLMPLKCQLKLAMMGRFM